MKERNQAIILMLLSALSFSLMQAVVKISATSVGTMQQVFCRNLVSMVIAFAILGPSSAFAAGGGPFLALWA